MQSVSNLAIQSVALGPAQEWATAGGSWRFLRLARGDAYWLEAGSARQLVAGEVLVLAPAIRGEVRASILGAVTLDVVSFASGRVLGLFSLEERQSLEQIERAHGSTVRSLPSTHPAARRFGALIQRGLQGSHPLLERAELLCVALSALGQEEESYCPPSEIDALAAGRFEGLVGTMPDVELLNYTARELAQVCRCSIGHFHRLFRARFGMSFRRRQAALSQAVAEVTREDVLPSSAVSSSPIRHSFDAELSQGTPILGCSGEETSPLI